MKKEYPSTLGIILTNQFQKKIAKKIKEALKDGNN